MTRTRFQARTSETPFLLKKPKQLTGAVCGPPTLGALLSQDRKPANWKAKTSLKKREDKRKTHTLFITSSYSKKDKLEEGA